MPNTIHLTLPIYWVQEFKTKPDKSILVGLNWYRNAHYRQQSQWKLDFHELVHNQLDGTTIPSSYTLEIKVYYLRTCDASNLVPLAEKVVLDALQDEGVLQNDNVNFHLGTCWTVAGQDKTNPRCEITIKSVDK